MAWGGGRRGWRSGEDGGARARVGIGGGIGLGGLGGRARGWAVGRAREDARAVGVGGVVWVVRAS